MTPSTAAEPAEDDLFDEAGPQRFAGSVTGEEDEFDIPHGEIDYLHDIPLSMHAVVGSVQKSVKELLTLKTGSVVEFDKVVGEPMDVMVGERLMCRGEIVVVNEHYGIRISEVLRATDSLKAAL